MTIEDDTWEDLISLNSNSTIDDFELLEPAGAYRDSDSHPTNWDSLNSIVDQCLRDDEFPLPTVEDREGYYGPHHYSYWCSGLRDKQMLIECAEKYEVDLKKYLDIGCSSGRVIRHFSYDDREIDVVGCDINRRHVEWVNRHLPKVKAFHNYSLPTLPIADESVDLISAYSVFTHVEAFETSWLMEMKRILRPGGVCWITVHSEHTWNEMEEGWPLYDAMIAHPYYNEIKDSKTLPSDKTIFRWKANRSYSSNVFYNLDYIKNTWGKFLKVEEVRRRSPDYQDVIILRKT